MAGKRAFSMADLLGAAARASGEKYRLVYLVPLSTSELSSNEVDSDPVVHPCKLWCAWHVSHEALHACSSMRADLLHIYA